MYIQVTYKFVIDLFICFPLLFFFNAKFRLSKNNWPSVIYFLQDIKLFSFWKISFNLANAACYVPLCVFSLSTLHFQPQKKGSNLVELQAMPEGG